MSAKWFHHPDLSLPVVARRAEAELVDALAWYGAFLLTRGRSLWRSPSYPSRTAYWNAVGRLRKQGVIAYRRKGGAEPVLSVAHLGEADQSALEPERWWDARWAGLWYVLVYDVPEAQRRYRDHLRRLLLQRRCGYLQNSVWISPRDLRPLFDDLDQAAAVRNYAHLFESRTVLGHGPDALVNEAWDFDRLARIHQRLIEDFQHAIAEVISHKVPDAGLPALARQAAYAWRQAVALDPLLPRELHPPGYLGPEVFALHRALAVAIRRRVAVLPAP